MAYVKKNKEVKNLSIKDAEVIFKNFSGKRKEVNGRVVNEEGKRNFCVIIPDDIALKLQEDGWNIRILRPRDDDEPARYYLSVAVNYNYTVPPEIHMVSGRIDTVLDEDSVDTIDYAEIVKINLTIRPRVWNEASGDVRIKAYLKSMVVYIDEDEILSNLRDELDDGGSEEIPF